MRLPQTLLNRLRRDFSGYGFVKGAGYMWSPDTRQITFRPPADLSDIWTLMHEIAHAELGHSSYELDIELVSLEVEAWEHAKNVLAPRYDIQIGEDHAEDHLDTYRYWLNERSRCPQCGQNGFQATKNTYRCNNCRCLWRVNEARICRLKRTRLPSQNQIA